jgi:hypothetical protein
MVGITISNEENIQDKAIGISFRKRDQLTPDVIWSVFGKVAQSNARFQALDKLVLNIHYVKIPTGNGGDGIVAKGRSLANMAHLKRSIIEVNSENNYVAHELVITIAKLTNDPNYVAYLRGFKIRPIVDNLLATTGIDFTNGIPELIKHQEHFKEYRILVFGGLNCKDLVFDGQVESEKRINLIYDDVTHHYHVINSMTGALARRFVCKGCNKGCKMGEMHRCQETFTNYKAYRQGRKIRPVVDNLLATMGIDLTNGGVIPELIKFQEHFKEYSIVVFGGLNCKDLVFDGQLESEKRINLLYDDVTHHYHVINSMTGAFARRFVCKGSNKGYKMGEMHRCQETCSDCM